MKAHAAGPCNNPKTKLSIETFGHQPSLNPKPYVHPKPQALTAEAHDQPGRHSHVKGAIQGVELQARAKDAGQDLHSRCFLGVRGLGFRV